MTNYHAKNYANTIYQSLLLTQRLEVLWEKKILPKLLVGLEPTQPYSSVKLLQSDDKVSPYKTINLRKTFLRMSRI